MSGDSDLIWQRIKARPPAEALDWVLSALEPGATLTSVRAMPGARSSALHAIDVTLADGTRQRLVLRRFVREEWLQEEPDVPQRESAVLALVGQSELVAPRLIAADPEAEQCDVPAVLSTLLPGRVRLDPADIESYIGQMAAALMSIHEIDWRGTEGVGAWFPYTQAERLAVPPWSTVPEVYKRLIEMMHEAPPAHEDVFIHRDFHPGNVLWSRGRLSGVIDWSCACHGAPGFDVSYCEGNLAGLFGVDVAERFRQRYEALTGREVEPYWQLAAISDWMPETGQDAHPPSGRQWASLGYPGYTPGLLVARDDEYLRRVMARLG